MMKVIFYVNATILPLLYKREMNNIVECDCIFGYRKVAYRIKIFNRIKIIEELRNCTYCGGTGQLNPNQSYRKMIETNKYCVCENAEKELIYYPCAYERFCYGMLDNTQQELDSFDAHYKHSKCGRIYHVAK